jgi:hypothetical protein
MHNLGMKKFFEFQDPRERESIAKTLIFYFELKQELSLTGILA